jgi:hypothetical protein
VRLLQLALATLSGPLVVEATNATVDPGETQGVVQSINAVAVDAV